MADNAAWALGAGDLTWALGSTSQVFLFIVAIQCYSRRPVFFAFSFPPADLETATEIHCILAIYGISKFRVGRSQLGLIDRFIVKCVEN